MEACIIKNINRLMRDCEDCGNKDAGYKIICFTFTDEYNPKIVEACIHYKMMKAIHKLEQVSALFEFGYEVEHEFNNWKISIEWTSTPPPNPFENVSVD
jgi:hypothetical protein